MTLPAMRFPPPFSPIVLMLSLMFTLLSCSAIGWRNLNAASLKDVKRKTHGPVQPVDL